MLGILEDKKEMVSKNKYKITGNSTIGDLVLFYYKSPNFLRLSRAAQKDYESCLKIILEDLGSKRLCFVSAKLIEQAYEVWLKRGTYRANKIVSILSILFNKGLHEGVRMINPVPLMDNRVPNPPRKVLWTPEQVNTFLETAYSQWKWRSIGLIVQMGYEWGQRVGDLRLLTWDALDLDKKRMDLEQSKRGADVHLPISDPLLHVLVQQKESFGFQQYVAPQVHAADGAYKPYPKETLFKHVNDIKREAGLPDELTAMDMRRTVITEMVEAGVDVTQIKQVSGHTGINSLTPYIRHTYTGASEALAQRSAFKKDKE